ncbi:hypothetical protein ACIOKD_17115 [Streptomyces sp. NPDC087844]|uniref:hypothetical protein n=1 Tax=Streptomyces sp. NPDC087844 TaxID=3365805 RepID=UPI0037FC12F4
MDKDDNASGVSAFSGIDPDALKATIDSVQRDQEKLQDRASYYKTELAYYGLGAEELQDILHVASWARDELPMLKRRHHLSMNMDNSPYSAFKGMVQIMVASSRAAWPGQLRKKYSTVSLTASTMMGSSKINRSTKT